MSKLLESNKVFCKCCEKEIDANNLVFIGTQHYGKEVLYLYNCPCDNTLAFKEKIK